MLSTKHTPQGYKNLFPPQQRNVLECIIELMNEWIIIRKRKQCENKKKERKKEVMSHQELSDDDVAGAETTSL